MSLEELYEVWSSAMLSVALLFGMSEVSSSGLLSALLFVALLLGMSELLGSSLSLILSSEQRYAQLSLEVN